MIGCVDAGGIVYGVGVDPPAFAVTAALARIFDPPHLGRAQIGAFADYGCAHFPAIDTDKIICAVADIRIAFLR